MMRGVLLVLFSTILVGQRASSQGTAPMSKRLILPPPPPPPPPQNFHRDDKATVLPPPDPQEPIKELIDTGGVELILDIEFLSFESPEENRFKIVMSDTSNRYCATKGNCEGDTAKVVTEVDVIVYDIQSVKSKRTAVYFYIKNPGARTQLTMTTAQLEKMFDEERSAIERALGYSLDMGDLDGFVPFTNGLALESALIALLALIGLVILVFGFVAFVNYRNKKRDTKMTFDDLEMQQSKAITNVLPSDADPVVPASSLKKVKVDVTTNVYQSEILAETKRVIKPGTVKTDTELYAVVHKHEEKKLESTEENNDPPASPNAIVVTADVSSSNDGSSHSSDDEAVGPTTDRNFAPPDYEQATKDEAKVIESPDTEAAGTSEAPPASTTDEDLPPPPTSSGVLPPLPPPEEAKDPSTSSPDRKDSGSSSSSSSAKGSSSAGKEAAEVVGELENLIDDQSKNISEDKGLNNEGFETIVDDKGEPSTEL